MTLHRTIVLLLLFATTSLALLYVSTFPVEPGASAPEMGAPRQGLEAEPAGPQPGLPERAGSGRYAALKPGSTVA